MMKLAWFLLVVSVVGCAVTVPLFIWAPAIMNERNMLLLTLILSWAALWYAAIVAVQEARHNEERKTDASA